MRQTDIQSVRSWALTMQKVKEMIDANTIVGEPIRADGVTLVPVSKISVGFGSGGSDFGKKPDEDGRNWRRRRRRYPRLRPSFFLVISDGNVRVLSVDSAPQSTADRIIELCPR